MPGSAPFRLNRSGVLLALISAGFAGEAAAAAGRVDFITGGVTVSGRDGRDRPLAKGAELDSGDTIKTNDGRAQIRFTDGSYVSLQPNTDFAISDYKFDGNDGTERGFFGLLKGAMRTVTGAVGRVNRNAYRVTTPTATVGIRGTGGVIQINPDGSTLVIGTSGIWSLTNPAGSIDVPAGVSGLAPSEPNTPPSETNAQPQTSTAPVQPEEQGFVQGNQVNPDGTADLGTAVKPLVTGPGYASNLAFNFSSNPEIANNSSAFSVFDPDGRLTEVNLGGSNVYKLNGGTHAEFGTDGILAWGRWTGPVLLPGNLCESGSPCSTSYTPDQGLHYVVGMPTAVMPTQGRADYTVAGATSPTYATGSSAPGTFSGTLSIDFPTTRVLGNFTIAMPDGRGYALNSSGNASGSQFSLSTAVTGSGDACRSNGCIAAVNGFFAGANAERAGLGYHISDNSINGARDVLGAAAFKKSN